MDKFRGMSCLLLGARHMKDIVKKLWRVLGRIKPGDNKKLLKMVFKGRNKKRKSNLRSSALHDKIRSFFRQIVKLEHNTVSFRIIL